MTKYWISRKLLEVLIVAKLVSGVLSAQPATGSVATEKALDRLTHFGSVLMIAAHPDDEQNAVLAYLSLGRGMRTGYLSLTRGEGGQNLIGPEKGAELGLIRTQELLAGRRIDLAEQYFSRAIDFGFTKTADEAIAKWGRDEIVSDVTWVIRRFRPDVVMLRFTGTPADGHGQHQASAILGREAIIAAADPNRYPEQLKYVQPWKVQRVVQLILQFGRNAEPTNTAGLMALDTGQFDPVLGRSYAELAGVIRSLHRSQGQGTPERRGPAIQYARNEGPEKNLRDVFEGLDLTWKRLPGGEEIGRLLERASAEYRPAAPDAVLPLLLEARSKLAKLQGVDAERRLREVDDTIAQVTGLWVDVNAPAETVTGANVQRQVVVLNRSKARMELTGIAGHPVGASELPMNTAITQTQRLDAGATTTASQPYWLRDPVQGSRYTVKDQELRGIPEPFPEARESVTVRINGTDVTVLRPVQNRYVDEVYGERTRTSIVEPPVTVSLAEEAVLFPARAAKTVTVEVSAHAAAQTGAVRLDAPQRWTVQPASQQYNIAKAGEMSTMRFEVVPPGDEGKVQLRAIARTSGGAEVASAKTVISYSHIPQQTVFEDAAATAVRADVRVSAHHIGYITGAGDEIPEALRQMGCDVLLLGTSELAEGDLSHFDAIVVGIRAFNVRPDLKSVFHRLLEYVNGGGTLVVQYNTAGGGGGSPEGPYPVTFGRGRVTVEDSPVVILDKANPILHQPNEITDADFMGWVQERGLYFASTWDAHYTPLFEMTDPGEAPQKGSTLVARYGKGTYVFTALAFFRQLPAGVPGAYKLFANLVSAGKTLH